MTKAIIHTILTMGFYLLAMWIFYLLIHNDIVFDFIYSVNESLLFVDSLYYLLLIGILLIYIKIYGKSKYSTSVIYKITLNDFFQVIFIAMFFRITVDPIFRWNMIMGKSNIPVIEVQKSTPLLDLINTIFVIVLVGPILEEILFRKIMLDFYAKRHLIIGIVLSSLFFASIHFNSSFTNYPTIFITFVFGLIASFIYLNKGLLYSIMFHISYNAMWLVIQEHKKNYWEIIRLLDFGVLYWLLITISFSLFLYVGYKSKNFLLPS